MLNSKLTTKQFDLVIIGSGGAGLMAAISAFDAGVKKIAVISKVAPTSSHTVAAKGGINAALGNVAKDDWKWHAYDTIKGSDFLADKDAVDILCKGAAEAIIELEQMGVVFSRDAQGKIAQRAYGGQTSDFGKGAIAYRACYSKDKTGQTILHTLYNEALKRDVKFFGEFFVTDLFIENKACFGCLAIDLNQGEFVAFESATTIIATGGYSQIYRNTTSSLICTGDGSALVFKIGLPLQDMEFIQFHPTGIANKGFLISEAARGEGAQLLNANDERFMKNYDAKMMELSSRDIIARAIASEIIAGRGVGAQKNAVYLDLTNLSEDTLNQKLPGIVELAKNFAKCDARKDRILVAPTAHYTMGGIPTNLDCEVVDFNDNTVLGLMAVGEAACISVHGANRLGCNSLLDLIIFGKIAGKKSSQLIKNNPQKNISNLINAKLADVKNILNKNSSQNFEQNYLSQIKIDLQAINEKHLGVFRNHNLLEKGYNLLIALYKNYKNYTIKNKNLLWNDELILYFEIENLFLNSFATFYSALERKESRGSHYRSDFATKDENWHFHSLVIANDKLSLSFKKKKIK